MRCKEKRKNQQLTAENLPMNVKLVLQQLGPQKLFEASFWGLSSNVDLSSMPDLLRAKYSMCSCWQLSTSQLILLSLPSNTSKEHKHHQARSQEFATGGGGCLGVWGLGGKTSSRQRHGGLGAEPRAFKIFEFFCKNNFILGLF